MKRIGRRRKRTSSEDHPLDLDLRSHLAAIVDSSDDAIFSKDLDGRILSWNRGAERLYGYVADEIIGQSASVLVPDDRPDEEPNILATLRSGGTVDHFETVRIRKDGTEIPVSATVSPVRDGTGSIVAASSIARDISEGRRLAEHAARFESILAAAEDAFVEMDADGIIVHWNAAAVRLLGWTAEEAVGRRLSETIIPERYRVAHEQGLRHYLNSGEGPVIGQRVALEALRRDGTEVPIELAVFVIPEEHVLKFGAFIHDTSEHKRLAAELEMARDQALEASRLKSEFLATMSHEIRTPMNGVVGMAGLLLDTELDPEQREYAEIVRNSADALLGIINDILDFSKIEAGQLDFESVDINLHALVEEAVDLLAPHAHAKNLELSVLVRPDVPPVVRGDPGRLRQILLNLLSNAVKFTDTGEVVVRVTASDRTDGTVDVHFEVADTGIGIDRKTLDRLFEPFSQADSSTTRTHGGTGLGLAICRRLVEMLDGELTVTSEPGHGTTFEFTVPLPLSQPSPTRTLRTDLTGLRVLIVDDNRTNRRILEQQVRSWKMSSTTTDGGEAALQLLRDANADGSPFDLVILDKGMPGMDGVELTRRINNDPAVPTVPVVLLTSAGVRGSSEQARQAGVAAYLTKPVHQSQLFDTIAMVMGAGASSSPVTQATIAENRAADRPLVLVAEDNPTNQKVAAALLARIGYRTDIVGNGAEAVDAVKRNSYGAVLMDCQMPGMDGYEATRRIREAEDGEVRLPIIAMTAAAMEGEEERCLAAGMDDYTTKPVDRERLASVLKQWVRSPTNITGDNAAVAAGSASDTEASPFDETITATLRELMADEPGGFVGLVTGFVEDTAVSLAAIRTALAAGDTAAVGRELHTVTGAAFAIGADRLARACRRCDVRLSTDGTALHTREIDEIESELNRIVAWIRTH